MGAFGGQKCKKAITRLAKTFVWDFLSHGKTRTFFANPILSLVIFVQHIPASLVAQVIKHLPTMWETWVRSLGREDPLEKEMATHSSSLAWKIPWMEDPGRLQSMGLQRVGHD